VDHPLICVVGPTGAGKSSLAIHLAVAFQGEIVNCDSLQFYRGFDIGSAKTPETERQGVPHHLFDVLEPYTVYSAGDYARDARATLDAIRERGRLPIVVGGTGFYLRALLDGLPELPARQAEVRKGLAARELARPGTLHRILRRLEPGAAARIHPQDAQKLVRALEGRLVTGGALPDPAAGEPLSGYRVLEIGLAPDREKLVEAIAERTRAMFAQGLVEEVLGLLLSGCSGKEKPFETIGYKQVFMYLCNQMELDEARESVNIETRQYAKRQMTWFRRDARVRWIDGFGNDERTLRQASAWVAELLAGNPLQ